MPISDPERPVNLAFYQAIHENEFKRKDTLAQRASTIITGLTTLAGLLAFVAVNYKTNGPSIDAIFWVLAGSAAVALGVAGYFLVRSYRVPALNDIAKPKAWVDYWDELQAKYKKADPGAAFPSATEEFTDHLIRLYAEVAGENIDANFTRGERLVKANNALLSAFALLVLTSLAFYYSSYISPAQAAAPGGDTVFHANAKDALMCFPAGRMSGATEGPGKRPVPDPAPPPSPKN